MHTNKSFIGSLFDLSFSEFVTTQIIKIVYVLLIVASAFGALVILIGGIGSGNFLKGVGSIVLAVVLFALYVLVARIWMELLIVVFRIAENTGRLVELLESKNPEAESQPEQQEL